MTSTALAQKPAIALRRSTARDAAEIWRFVRDGDDLELNSPYAYALLTTHFGETCWVAEAETRDLAGFVAAYRPPNRADAVFVWQVGVASSWRGKGVGSLLLDRLVAECPREVRFLQATVTPSNRASESLFRGLGRRLDAAVEIEQGFPASLFPDQRAEPERLFTIGPFRAERNPVERL